jgi:2-oxoglutarate dehydrogenase E2 component (dihydrolipoamide succinyltransferase)
MEWKKNVGDPITAGEVIVVIETDKVTVEVKGEADGILEEILKAADETIEVGQPLAKIAPGGSGAAAPAASAPAPAAAAASAGAGKIIEQKCADFGAESITEGAIQEWKKNVGDFVAQGEIVCVIETDKVSVEVKAEEAGTIKEICAKVDDTVGVGQLLLKIETGAAPSGATAAAPTAAAPSPAAAAAPSPAGPPPTGLRATFARLSAKRLGLPDPTAVAAPAAAAPSAAPAAGKPAPGFTAAKVTGAIGRTEKRVPLSRIRSRVTQSMKDAQNTAALLTTFQEADMSAVLKLCSKYQDLFEKNHGTKLRQISIMAKATAFALMEEPAINGTIDGNEIVYHDYVDLGVPIPTGRGPVACVLRNVESKTVLEIEKELAGLAVKARKDQLSVEDLADATFSISDSASSGGMLGTGLISLPQSALLGTNAITPRPVAVGGKVEARPIMYMSLTYDHRLIDGREAVTFLVSVRDKLEDPGRMLIGL